MFKALSKDHPFSLLLAVIVALTLVAPALAALGGGGLVEATGVFAVVAFLLLFAVIFFVVAESRRTRSITLVLALPGLIFKVANLVAPSPSLTLAHFVLHAGFLLFVVVLILRYIFRSRRVTTDLISAALCAYLVLGAAWASVYGVIELSVPGSFHVPDDGLGAFVVVGKETGEHARRIYFSLVTLLTLGYGEITPVSTPARLSAVMEAFVGQVFLVVLVAKLVGSHVTQTAETPEGPEDDS